MKPLLVLFAGLLLFAPDAGAQVIINQAALDQLAGIAPPVITAPPAIRQKPRKVMYRSVRRRRITTAHRLAVANTVVKPAAPEPAAPEPAAPVRTAKPTVQPVVAKPAMPPAPPKPQPPPRAIIDFAAGDAGLPGNSAALLKPFCAHAPGIVTIDAYAAPDPADPSNAARLSLSRAFAIRDALTACGVPSANIIPRANGALKTKTPDIAEISAAQ